MKVIWSSESIKDLNRIYTYYAKKASHIWHPLSHLMIFHRHSVPLLCQKADLKKVAIVWSCRRNPEKLRKDLKKRLK